MARKREERAAKAAYRKEKQANNGGSKEETQNFVSFNNQLATMGLELREIPGDGNCLFRALGDQLEGHTRNHLQHREDTVAYMKHYRKDFEPFVEDDVSFDRYVENLNLAGTYAGNDAIVAFARLNGVTVVIHQLNSPLWKVIGEPQNQPNRELHIAYHNGDHYNSVRRIGDNSEEPANLSIGDKTSSSCVNPPQLDYDEEDNLQEENQNDDAASDEPVDVNVVQLVMDQSGCQDPMLVKQTLENHQNNVDAAIDFIINLTILSQQANSNGPEESSLWKENGTGMRLFGVYDGDGEHVTEEIRKPDDCGVKQKQPKSATSLQKFERKKHITNKQRKDLKRREQKHNNELRKKQKRLLNSNNSDSDSLENPTNIVQQLGCLNI